MSVFTKIKNRTKWLLSFPSYYFYKILFKKPTIRTIEDTIEKIIKDGCSITRYGDGELDIMAGRDIPFQKFDPILAKKMREALVCEDDKLLVGIHDCFAGQKDCLLSVRQYWKRNLRKNLKYWHRFLKRDKIYYNACISRPYMRYADKSDCKRRFDLLKAIWRDKDIVIIEGEKSRLGVGNDLFDGAKSIQRILGPAENAFFVYTDIIKYVKENISQDKMILLALGPTATAMAYDLHKLGYQVIDIGHVDIEYEWFSMGATEKIAIKNKYTNEAREGNIVGDIGIDAYDSQILVRINKDTAINERGGICFTFDDSYIDSWLKALPIFKKYNAHATFFFSGCITDSIIVAMRKLQAEGHSIGLHTVSHRPAREQIEELGIDNYYSQEIGEPLRICKSNGIKVESFAYPFNKNERTIDERLEKQFLFIRIGQSKVLDKGYWIADRDETYYKASGLTTPMFLCAHGIGEHYLSSMENLDAAICEAVKKRCVLVFYSHNICKNGKSVHMKTEWLEYLLQTAQRVNIPVIGFDELKKREDNNG